MQNCGNIGPNPLETIEILNIQKKATFMTEITQFSKFLNLKVFPVKEDDWLDYSANPLTVC